MTTAPAPAECMVTLRVAGQPVRTVESHHMVKRDGVWTCLHCGVTR